jgi:biopolymer transport protein ExbD
MSQRDSSNGHTGDTTMVTIMLVIATIFMIAGIVILQSPLKQFYDKFLWDWK